MTSADEATLRAALIGDGTVSFAVDGTITLASTLTITNDTTIDGSGRSVAISRGNAVCVLYVNPGVQFTL